jgi:nucleolar protein 15
LANFRWLLSLAIFVLASLGPEWDSSDEDEEIVNKSTIEDEKKGGKASAKSTKVASEKGGSNKSLLLKKKSTTTAADNDHSVLYIGHIPKELDEQDLITFLSQFGKVVNCRLARKIETGNPKGYAFVKFDDTEVAQIATETLHGYFLGKQRLVCHLRSWNEKMFYDTDQAIVKHKHKVAVARQRHEKKLSTVVGLKAITTNLLLREQQKREKLAALGVDYDFPGYSSCQVANSNDDDGMTTPKKENQSTTTTTDSSKGKKRKESMNDKVGDDVVVETNKSTTKTKRKDSISSIEGNAKKAKNEQQEQQLSINDQSSDKTSSSSKKKKNEKVVTICSPPPVAKDNNNKNTKSSVGRLTRSARKDTKKQKHDTKDNRRVSVP